MFGFNGNKFATIEAARAAYFQFYMKTYGRYDAKRWPNESEVIKQVNPATQDMLSGIGFDPFADDDDEPGGFDPFADDDLMLEPSTDEIRLSNWQVLDGGAAPTMYSAGKRTVEQAAQEQAAQQSYFKSLVPGYQEVKTLFPPGTEMIDIGKEAFHQSARAHEDKPLAYDEAMRWATIIENEERDTINVDDFSKLTMDVDGEALVLDYEGERFTVEHRGFQSLIGRLNTRRNGRAGLGPMQLDMRNFEKLTPEDRAYIFNKQVFALDRALRNGTLDEDDLSLQLHTRTQDGGETRRLFTTTSRTYLQVPSNLLLRATADALRGSDARGEGVYNPHSTFFRFDWTLHAPVNFDAHVGDVHRAGGSWSTKDNGNGKYNPGGFIERILCVNFTRGSFEWMFDSVVHRGSQDEGRNDARIEQVLSQVRKDVRSTSKILEPMAEQFRAMKEHRIIDLKVKGKSYDDPRDVLEAMVVAGEITDAVARDTLVNILLDGFDAEPGEGLEYVAHAVTQAAKSRELDLFQRQMMEESAGRLMATLPARIEAQA